MVWPALIGAAATLGSAYLNNRGRNRNAGGSQGSADSYLSQIDPMARGQFNPYIQQGNEAQGLASGKYNQMAYDPMDYINQLISGYKPSEGYKFKEQKALDAARNSAAAGGFSGTRNDQMQQGEMAQGMAGQDMQEWLSNVLGVQGAGLSGQQHVADRGYNASQNLAGMLGDALGSRSSLAYEDTKQRQGNNQGMMGGLANIIGMGANAMGNSGMFGGGSSGGGAAGGMPMGGRGIQPFGQNYRAGSGSGMFGTGGRFGSIYGGGRG
jgi:hypothetical protein